MSVVKVLIVDDSPVIREKILKWLRDDPEIEVVGIADGKDNAMEKIAALKPDVLTMNLKSRQDSTAFLKTVSTQASLPVVVITETAIDDFYASKAGAVHLAKMPLVRTSSTIEEFTKRLAQQLKTAAKSSSKAAVPTVTSTIPKTQALEPPARAKEESAFGARAVLSTGAAASRFAPEPKAQIRRDGEFSAKVRKDTDTAPVVRPVPTVEAAPADATSTTARAVAATAAAMQKLSPNFSPKGKRHVIALGASTGGTDALHAVLQDLPVNTPGIVIVQHMPEMFTKMYADRLDRGCKMKCVEAVDGERVEVGKIILAAGNFHLRLAKDSKGYYVTSQHGEKVSGHCPSVDVLFESVANVAGKDAIGAIFTGMGADGAAGLKKMRDAGAFTIGQDKETCVVYGMPMVAYNMGAVCQQAPLNKIPQIILENC